MTTLAAPISPPRLANLAKRREFALAILIALIVIAVSIRNPAFLRPDTLGGILLNCVQPAIVACGVMLVIVTGEIDISVGASLGFLTSVLGIFMSRELFPEWAAWFAETCSWLLHGFHLPQGYTPPAWTQSPFSVAAAILLTLLLGTATGIINGLLVTLVRIPSIIVTLAMLTILKGLTVMLMKKHITDVPASFHFIGTGDLGDALHFPFHLGHLSLYIAALILLL